MLPPTRRLDPNGYYAQLGLDPAASAEAVTAAFRRKARVLHPDVQGTGDTASFVAVRHAYDVLSNPERRERYDRSAREAEEKASAANAALNSGAGSYRAGSGWVGAEMFQYRPVYEAAAKPGGQPGSGRTLLFVWFGIGMLLSVGVVEAILHLRSPPVVADAGIKPTAAPVEPLTATAQRAVLYGPTPVRLAGVPNFYILPAGGPTLLWRQESDSEKYQPIGQLPPFSSVQALRVNRQTGMAEVRFNDSSSAFIDSKRLAPGDASAAHRAYCGYNAGASPFDGEVLEQRGQGSGTLAIDNRTVQPAVVKLRENTGGVVLSVFLGPGGQTELAGLPAGEFRAEFAIGEFWSRACNAFAAGMRARRLVGSLSTAAGSRLVLPSGDDSNAADIADHDFEHQ